MMQRRSWRTGAAVAILGLAFAPGCGRKSAEVNLITPSISVNRAKAPLGSAIEVEYSFSLDPAAKKLGQDYRVLVHFLDSHKVVLFTDDHLPPTPTSAWEPGKTYSYKRTVFIPVYPYVGDVQVVMGLYPAQGRGERLVLKGEDYGLREFKVSKMELQPQTENIFVVYKDGWHNPETHPQNPAVERTWTKKEALASFKNPKKDVLVYLEADTCFKCYPEPPVLTVSLNGKAGVTIPIDNAEVFLKKIRFKADDLGAADWADLHFSMNQSFVPKLLTPPMNNDDRELGVLVYHLWVGEAEKLGAVPAESISDAAPMAPAPAAKGAKTPAKTPAKPAVAQPTPAPKTKS